MASQSPMDITYMRMMRRSLHYLGSWPYSAFGESRRALPLRHHRFLFCFWTFLLVLQLLYIRDNIHKLSFLEMGNNYITVMMTIVDIQRITMPSMKSYQEIIKMFVTEIHLLHFKHKSEYATKVYGQVDRYCKFFCYLLYVQVPAATILFNITPLINNYRAGMFSSHRPQNGTFEQSTYYKLPFDYQTNFIGYLSVFIFNDIITFDVGCSFGLFDIILSIIVFHTWGHLKILEHNFRNFPRPEMRPQEGGSSYLKDPPLFTTEESERIAQLLKDNIDHHRLLIYFVNKTSSAFGPMLCVYYTFHQVSGCILLLECSQLDAQSVFKFVLMTVVLFQQLIQLSIIFELIGSRGDKLADAVYSVPWECMRRSERRTVLIFLCNVQTPIRVKAMGIVLVGVRTMAAILKTTFTYFLMLRTIST